MSEPSIGPKGSVRTLARELRRSIGGFVRAVRRDAATPRTAQTEALDLLGRHGPLNVAGLAERRGVTHQAMRLAVEPLLSAGWVRRVTDPADRRSRLLSITPAGRDALAREQDQRASHIEAAIRERLSPEEQGVLRAAVPLLDRLAAAPADVPPG